MAYVKFKRDLGIPNEKYEVYGARENSRKTGDSYSGLYDEYYNELLLYLYGKFDWIECDELEPYDE
jgi:hypothetical protein